MSVIDQLTVWEEVWGASFAGKFLRTFISTNLHCYKEDASQRLTSVKKIILSVWGNDLKIKHKSINTWWDHSNIKKIEMVRKEQLWRSGSEYTANIFLKGHHCLNQRLPKQVTFQDKHWMLSGKEVRTICVKEEWIREWDPQCASPIRRIEIEACVVYDGKVGIATKSAQGYHMINQR